MAEQTSRISAPIFIKSRILHTSILLLLIIVFCMALRLPRLSGNLDDYDTWRQTDTASIARLFLDEPNLFYPRIYWGAPGPGYVETEFQIYTFAVSMLYRIFGEHAILGRLLSVLFNGVACYVFYRIARRFMDEGASLLAVALFGLSPLVFRYSRNFMPESLVLLLYLLALERFLAWISDENWLSIMISALWMALAILVKPTSIHLGLVFICLIVVTKGISGLFRIKPALFGFIALMPAVLWYAHAAGLHIEYGNTFGVLSGGDPKWGDIHLWMDPGFYVRLLSMDVLWILGPVGFLCALVGIFFYSEPGWRRLLIPWGITLVLYYMIVGRYAGFQGRGLQYHIFAAPLLSIAGAAGLSQVIKWLPFRQFITGTALVLLILSYQLWGNWQLIHQHNPVLRQAGLALAEISAPDDLVLVLSHDSSKDGNKLNNYQEPDVFYHSRRWGRSLGVDQQSAEALTRAMKFRPRWFVNFPELNRHAKDSFLSALTERMNLVKMGEGYEIYQFNDDQFQQVPTDKAGNS